MPSFSASVISGTDVLVGELAPPALEQLLAGARGDEHPDSSSLVENPVGDQLVQALGCGGGVDPVEGGQLVGRGRLGLLGEGPVDDRVLDLVGDLPEDGAGVLVHGGRPGAPGLRRVPGFITHVMNHRTMRRGSASSFSVGDTGNRAVTRRG